MRQNDPTPCDHLDDYLDRDLAADSRDRFDEHLKSCADCRRVVEWQCEFERISQAQSRSEVSGLEQLCASIAENASRASVPLEKARLDRWHVSKRMSGRWLTICAASIIGAVIGFAVLTRWQADYAYSSGESAVSNMGQASPMRAAPAAADDVEQSSESARPFHARVEAENALLIAQPTDQPNVTIFLVYPTLNADASPQLPNRGDEGP